MGQLKSDKVKTNIMFFVFGTYTGVGEMIVIGSVTAGIWWVVNKITV